MTSMNSASGFSPTPPRPEQPLYIDPARPAFRVTNPKGFFSRKHTLMKAGTPVYLEKDQEPNDGLWPLNELGFNKMIEFLRKQDELGAKKASIDGKAYSSQEKLFLHKWNYTQQAQNEGEVIGQAPNGVPPHTPIFPTLSAGADEIGGRTMVPFMTGMPEVFGQAPGGDNPIGAAVQHAAAVAQGVRPGPSGARAGNAIDAINSVLDA